MKRMNRHFFTQSSYNGLLEPDEHAEDIKFGNMRQR
jgi:hypothetical protein